MEKELARVDSHPTSNLKVKIRDMRRELERKTREMDELKTNVKVTKLNELEVEMKLYVDECTRLRHMLEEVLRSRDPLADPEEVARIQAQVDDYQAQNENLAMLC